LLEYLTAVKRRVDRKIGEWPFMKPSKAIARVLPRALVEKSPLLFKCIFEQSLIEEYVIVKSKHTL
jgi:hypothetical protein